MDNDTKFGNDKAINDRKCPFTEYFKHIPFKIAIPATRERINNIGNEINKQKGQKGKYQPFFICTN